MSRVDPFSFNSSPGLWINQNWLTHVIFTLVHRGFGLAGLGLLKIGLCVAIVSLTASTARVLGSSRSLAVLAGVGVALVGRSFFDIRPNLITILLAAILIRWLAGIERRTLVSSWPLIPLTILWANLHGGFLYSILALGTAVAVVGVLRFVGSSRPRGWPAILFLPPLCLAATLASPLGLMNLIHPYEVSFGPASAHWREVVEWKPPYVSGAWEEPGVRAFWIALALVTVLLAFAIVRTRHRKPDPTIWPVSAVALLSLLLALGSRRFIPIFCVSSFPVVAAFVGRNLLRRRVPTILLAGTVALLGIAVATDISKRLLLPNAFWSRDDPWAERLVRYDDQPHDSVHFLLTSNLRGRLLNDWTWGGYLLYRTPFEEETPRYQIFIDGRAQAAYPMEVSGDWIALTDAAAARDRETVSLILDHYRIDLCLLDRRGAGLALLIPEIKGWDAVYADDLSVVAARSELARNLRPGDYPNDAVAQTSAGVRIAGREGEDPDDRLAAFAHFVGSLRAQPTTTGIFEMTILALTAPDSIQAPLRARAIRECDRILRGGLLQAPEFHVVAVEANAAQSRAFLAKAEGDTKTEKEMRRRAKEGAAQAERLSSSILR